MSFDAALLDALVADLRAASSWLLEAGTAPVGGARSFGGGGSAWRLTLQRIGDFGQILPRLLGELEDTGLERTTELVPSHTPRRAVPSRRPQDFVAVGAQRLVPTRWLRLEPIHDADPAAVGWLAHLTGCLETQLDDAAVRVARHLDDLLGEGLSTTASEFARARVDALAALREEITAARRTLERCHQALRAVAGWSLRATPRRPWPFPGGASWSRMIDFAARIEDPRTELPRQLHLLLGAPAIADVPHLYERWCALMVVEAVQRAGFALAVRDPVPGLFLGGCIDFTALDVADRRTVRMWITPRIPPAQDADAPHESGLSTNDRGEATPDILLVGGLAGLQAQAFVLDPTFNLGFARSQHKARYRSRIAFHEPRRVAGVPSRVPPARAWAAQPLERSGCDLRDPEGHTGVVPLHPLRRDFTGLDAWLADLWPKG